jgi:ATP-dependent DNA helicase
MTDVLIDVVPEDADALVDGVADWSEQKKYDVFACFSVFLETFGAHQITATCCFVDRLDQLLHKTSIFSHLMAEKIKQAAPLAPLSPRANVGTKRKAVSQAPDYLQSLIPSTLQLRPHQRIGIEWLISLYENGLNGILADDMGLGKTIQLLTLLLHLRKQGVAGPFLVVAPLSTLTHWKAEAERCGLPTLLYHGTQSERADIRASQLKSPLEKKFPLVVTSYELAMNDRKYLARFTWRLLAVDEGHRLKNAACRLLRALHSLPSEQRLLLTGTPLQNGLAELWSLLHFLMPAIFDDVDRFRAWFTRLDDVEALDTDQGRQQLVEAQKKHNIVSKLHDVLRPFVLRRSKGDVFGVSAASDSLPPKREVQLSTPLTALQFQLFREILDKALIASQFYDKHSTGLDVGVVRAQQISPASRKTRSSGAMSSPKEPVALSLQNVYMQLRKICNHPYLLIDEQTDEQHRSLIDSCAWQESSNASNDQVQKLIGASGKFIMLHRLLSKLCIDGDHKVLVFSQFTKTLDILEEYLMLSNMDFCRLDGNVTLKDRQASIARFSNDSNVRVFLLSTRAGGLGLNLVAADTVILFDSDFNPQVDAQAMDRCHRIGQTKPVTVYRFITPRSVETAILARANAKKAIATLAIDKAGLDGVSLPVTESEDLEGWSRGEKHGQMNVQVLADLLSGIDVDQEQGGTKNWKTVSESHVKPIGDDVLDSLIDNFKFEGNAQVKVSFTWLGNDK